MVNRIEKEIGEYLKEQFSSFYFAAFLFLLTLNV